MISKDKIRLSLSINRKQLEKIRKHCKELGITVSDLFVMLFDRYLTISESEKYEK